MWSNCLIGRSFYQVMSALCAKHGLTTNDLCLGELKDPVRVHEKVQTA